MGYKAKQTIVNREIFNSLEALKEHFKILSNQKNANQKDSETPSYTSQNRLRPKNQVIKQAIMDVEQGEHSSTTGGNVEIWQRLIVPNIRWSFGILWKY